VKKETERDIERRGHSTLPGQPGDGSDVA
jgi:hypothetical protein